MRGAPNYNGYPKDLTIDKTAGKRRSYKAAKGKFHHKLPHWVTLLENPHGKEREWQIGRGLELNDGISSHTGHASLTTPLGIEFDLLSW